MPVSRCAYEQERNSGTSRNAAIAACSFAWPFSSIYYHIGWWKGHCVKWARAVVSESTRLQIRHVSIPHSLPHRLASPSSGLRFLCFPASSFPLDRRFLERDIHGLLHSSADSKGSHRPAQAAAPSGSRCSTLIAPRLKLVSGSHRQLGRTLSVFRWTFVRFY